MSFTVISLQKGSSSGGVGNHIDRVQGKEHSYKNANPEKIHLNQSWNITEHCKLPLHQAIKARIEEGYTGKTAIRKDAVKSINIVLSGSHERMVEIFADEEKKKNWLLKNAEFITKQYGLKNIVRFTLHLDEKTPHLHVVVVPLTEEGRLSAKKVMGNRQAFRQLHTFYAEEMKDFGLKRGIERTPEEKPSHSTIENFYKATQDYEKAKKITSKKLKNISPRDKTKLLKSVLEGEKIASILENRDINLNNSKKI